MNDKCCGNCRYFDGQKGDGIMRCNYSNYREGYVYEDSCCRYHVTDPEKNNETYVQGEYVYNENKRQ